jgi:hypothetical protein
LSPTEEVVVVAVEQNLVVGVMVEVVKSLYSLKVLAVDYFHYH